MSVLSWISIYVQTDSDVSLAEPRLSQVCHLCLCRLSKAAARSCHGLFCPSTGLLMPWAPVRRWAAGLDLLGVAGF